MGGGSHLDLGAGRVVEVDVLELDVALDAVGRDVATVVVDGGDAVEELEDAAGGADGLHELGEDGDEGGEGEDGLEREEHVGDEAADRHLVLEDELAAVPHGHEDAGVAGEIGDGGEAAGDPGAALDDEVGDVDLVGVVADLLLLHHVRADGPDVGERLVGLGASVGEGDQLLFGENLHAETLQEHAHGNDRNEREHHERQLPIVGENGDQADHHLAEGNKPPGQVGRHNHLNHFRVRGQAIQQLTNSNRVEKSHILSQHITED